MSQSRSEFELKRQLATLGHEIEKEMEEVGRLGESENGASPLDIANVAARLARNSRDYVVLEWALGLRDWPRGMS